MITAYLKTATLESVGRRVGAYVRGNAKLEKIEQAWCDAAYWVHEGLAEPLDTIAVAKLETAIEALHEAGSGSQSKQRRCQAMEVFYGRKETDLLNTDPSKYRPARNGEDLCQEDRRGPVKDTPWHIFHAYQKSQHEPKQGGPTRGGRGLKSL
ncbi:MAG: hypothetical protein JOY71_06485 [Acetobacteraceae bacterium]|nr:hypothetical protein [Acetobacteraceae bacterium]